MKKLIVALCVGVLWMATATAAELKIGVVDAGSAIAESNAYKQERERIAKIERKINANLQKLEQRIVAGRNDFQKNNAQWNADTALARQKDIADLEIRFNREKSDGIQVLKRENEQLNGRAVKMLNDTIQQFGKESDYTLILQKNPAVMFDDGSRDVTADIVRQMNRTK
ncbi:MAG: hypothetical protein COW18_11355 [Zetaproteobacteria bacterium CG12_big_fil_rev_8_21_14_0_65_54_13]|nr:MAG: hypothetical protein COW18_11355 [Zetaproteobacteria bacterium CG12_big_fil_rev_8_21_14_0_65_54_13]PIX54195.1 MAG: hypothetical protein COZ50_09140 [Zetaproteobacteria bacterium CG_4_10_14_3_um_filter_54_28]PJA29076.1 MAG: hypothetical protein CO188_07540 [Zetaproteobacteria bacterium CG_4_9_14_3_um_filter_54_145]